ncbi:MAG: DUF3043 domain-containing protein [Segniliparus sp.]|uniref:DUF3043 domain-containing protein n=1 Tax=Segniliparus sp. TaxID=2804064 RepID=UPI003F311C54
MKLPWTRHTKDDRSQAGAPESNPSAPNQPEQAADAPGENTPEGAGGKTQGKGRPTPKRRDAAGARRGPLPPAPLTGAEARARRKALAGPKLSRDERRAQGAARRERQTQARERMLAGEEAYLLPRDKGPVRAYVRDVIDSRRSVSGAFMPVAFVMIGASLIAPAKFQVFAAPAMLVLLAAMVLEGLWLGRKVNNLVRLKFPDSTEPGLGLGWYAFSRATQMRRMRVPKPRATPKDKDQV